jgi:cytochrome o ubiquinol oxidase subunit 3
VDVTALEADDPHKLGRAGREPHGGAASAEDGGPSNGPASKRIVVGYGFWIFLLSDIVMFSGFFSAYAVLSKATAGGPGPKELFERPMVALETAVLLTSSFTCGLMSLAAQRRSLIGVQASLLATGMLGAGFLLMEAHEFSGLVSRGFGPQRSAFLSAFFTLVGCHGVHVAAGLLWLGTMMAQVFAKGFRTEIQLRLLCFSLFWHALDIIWVALFNLVYLMGTVL